MPMFHPFNHLSIHPSIHLSIHSSIHSSIHPSTLHISIFPSIVSLHSIIIYPLSSQMLQLVQPERVLYLQAKNSVDQLEWYVTIVTTVRHGKYIVFLLSTNTQWGLKYKYKTTCTYMYMYIYICTSIHVQVCMYKYT